MRSAILRWRLPAVTVLALWAGPAAQAQAPPVRMGGGAVSPTGASPGLYANPYANPYLNPFLNPYMTQYPTSAGSAGLYFFAAQQATGGLGSGRLSGVRPGPSAGAAEPAPAPTRRVSDRPAANAAHYFSRGGRQTGGVGRYYNRPNRYFPK